MKNQLNIAAVPLLAVAALWLTGCATCTIRPIAPAELKHWNETNLPPGFVFYQSELYFLVTATPPKTTGAAAAENPATADEAGKKSAVPKADQAAGFSVTPIFLPNPARPYRVTTFNFLARSDFTLNFKDGWQLVSLADKADNTAVAAALTGQMKTILDVAARVGFGPGQTPPQTFLLHPEFTDAGIIKSFTPIPVPDLAR